MTDPATRRGIALPLLVLLGQTADLVTFPVALGTVHISGGQELNPAVLALMTAYGITQGQVEGHRGRVRRLHSGSIVPLLTVRADGARAYTCLRCGRPVFRPMDGPVTLLGWRHWPRPWPGRSR